MSQKSKTIGLCFTIISLWLPMQAEERSDGRGELGKVTATHGSDTTSVRVCFRFDDAMVLRDYRTNNAAFSRIDSLMSETQRIDSIAITGFTSPDGVYAYNLALSLRRAEAMKSYLHWRHPATYNLPISLSIKRDLADYLLGYINEDTKVPRRKRVIQILSDQSRSPETRIANLRLIAGDSFHYIQKEIYPQMRMVVSYIIYFKKTETPPTTPPQEKRTEAPTTTPVKQAETIKEATIQKKDSEKNAPAADVAPAVEAPVAAVAPATVATVPTTEAPSATHPTPTETAPDTITASDNNAAPPHTYTYKPLFALKTNLLFDALTALNLEIEVPIGQRWSVAGELIFPWWLDENTQRCLQLMNANIEGRYWWGNRQERLPLTGWFAGLYAGGGYYDLEWESRGYQGEFFIAAGLSGGYAHTINKKGNLRMEYALGVGFMQTNYREYVPQSGGDVLMWQRNGRLTWFGPTRAKVSLVWMLNYKSNKGGRK